MRDIGLRMVRQLDWRDFETLVDLIFARGGWQRSSARPDPHATDNGRVGLGADQIEG
jgi:hypothetical protein